MDSQEQMHRFNDPCKPRSATRPPRHTRTEVRPAPALQKEFVVKATLCTALTVAALMLTVASGSEAACMSPNRTQGLPSIGALFASPALPGADGALTAESEGKGGSIVGLWQTTFLFGDGPTVYDEAYEIWHGDGTELAIDNAVPPSLGNVCVGVWRQEGRSIKLRHVTWNWNPDGTKAGTFLLLATLTVGSKGHTFSGHYVTDSFDVDGNVIPELHAEGVVQGRRITVD
jgi:hypothetical protein